MFIYDKKTLIIKDLKLIITMNEKIAHLKIKNGELLIEGENLEIVFLEYNEIHLQGNIKNIKLWKKDSY